MEVLERIFKTVIELGYASTWVILAVLLLRCALRRMPKRYSYLLWAIPAVRLLIPIPFAGVWGMLGVKMAVDGSGFFVPPGTPFVKHQGYVLFRVVLIHDRDMLFYHIFYFQAFPHCPVIIVFVEICCRAFAAVPTGNGVVM